MGYPVAPLVLLLLLLLLPPTTPSAPLSCFQVPADAPTNLNLTNSTHGCTELDWGLFQRQSQLWLSHNGILALSPLSRIQPGLQELDLSYNRLRELPAAFLSQAQGLRHLHLQHNQLQELPSGFFTNATALQTLRLEGNPLPAVPPSAFQPSLRTLSVQCRCDVVGSVLALCNCTHCARLQCHCLSSHQQLLNVTGFHSQQCQSNVGLALGLAGAAAGILLLLVATTAAVCYWRRRRRRAASAVWGKWEPTVAQGQPHYVSRATEVCSANAAPDYENVFVTPCAAPAPAQGWMQAWQEEQCSPQPPEDGDYFLEASDGEQPIYANTQGPTEDNLYITPDRD